MMTTETRPDRRSAGVGVASLGAGVLVGVLVVTSLVAGVATALGAVLSGGEAALGAAVGAAIVIAVFGLGCGSLALVARALPSATLLVALVTYVAQVVAMLVVFVKLADLAVFADGPGRAWLAIGLITATMSWLTAQLLLTMRARVPYFDLRLDPRPGER